MTIARAAPAAAGVLPGTKAPARRASSNRPARALVCRAETRKPMDGPLKRARLNEGSLPGQSVPERKLPPEASSSDRRRRRADRSSWSASSVNGGFVRQQQRRSRRTRRLPSTRRRGRQEGASEALRPGVRCRRTGRSGGGYCWVGRKREERMLRHGLSQRGASSVEQRVTRAWLARDKRDGREPEDAEKVQRKVGHDPPERLGVVGRDVNHGAA
jgi:hypothetical protein